MTEILDLVERFLTLPQQQRDLEFVTVKEAALRLGKHESRIRQMRSEGRLRGLKIYGRVVIHLPSVKAALKAATAE
jgi:excisionase family DNA binding protein